MVSCSFCHYHLDGFNSNYPGQFSIAGGKHKKSNETEQAISQIQGLKQTSGVSSGGDTLLSGNNLGFLFNLNEGNNALGQQ